MIKKFAVVGLIGIIISCGDSDTAEESETATYGFCTRVFENISTTVCDEDFEVPTRLKALEAECANTNEGVYKYGQCPTDNRTKGYCEILVPGSKNNTKEYSYPASTEEHNREICAKASGTYREG